MYKDRHNWIYLAVAIIIVLRISSLSMLQPYPDELDYWVRESNEVLANNFHLPQNWFSAETIGGVKKLHLAPPLYPYLGAAISRLGNCSTLFSLRLVSVIAVSLSALIVYFLGAALFSPEVGILGFWLCSTQALSTTTSNGNTHTLLTFLALGFMLAYLRSLQRHSTLNSLLAGVFLGLAILTQWTGLLVLACFIFYAILQAKWIKPQVPFRRQIWVVLPALGLVLPYVLALFSKQIDPFTYYLKYQRAWGETQGSKLAVGGINLPGPAIALGMFTTIFHGSAKHLWQAVSASPLWLKPPIMVFVLIPVFLFILGFISAGKQVNPDKKPMLYLIQIYLLAFIGFYMLYTFKFTTYWITVFPLVCLLLAQYIYHTASTARRLKRAGIIFVAVYLILANVAASVYFLKVGGEFGAVSDAALLIDHNIKGEFVLAFQYPTLIAYHLKRMNHPVQIISLDQVKDLSAGPEYILIREDYIRRYFAPEQFTHYYKPLLKAENRISPFRDYFLYRKI